VPPAYGDFSLALVMHSNEGGPGPRHNMKEDPGSSTLIMLKVHGCHLYLVPRFSEAGENRNRRMGLPPPHQSNQDRAPSHPLQVHTPPPAKVSVEAGLGEKHTSASGSRSEAMDWARGGCGGHFELFSSSLGGQTAELVTSAGWPARYSIALLSSWMRNPWQACTTGQVHGRPVQDRSLFKESPCTFLPLSYNTRRSPHLQTPRKENTNEIRGRTDCCDDLQAK
jgi:hypothetical protein